MSQSQVPYITVDEMEWFSHSMGGTIEPAWDYGTIPPEVMDAAGEFHPLTLHELRAMLPANYRRNDQPRIIYRVRDDKHRDDDLFDTSALQFNSDPNCRALFQVASNYDALELGSAWQNPFNPSYLTGLMSDTTQGPSAAGGAGAGAILRSSIHRFGPIEDRPKTLPSVDQPVTWVPHDYSEDEGTAGGYINMLSKVQELADAHTHGKLFNVKDVVADLPAVGNLTEDWAYNVQIGLHMGVRAQYHRGKYAQETGMVKYNKDGPRIDQVYTSTCIYSYGQKPAREDLTDALLKAAYDGTYMAAAVQQNRKLVLTFIGGNEFANPKPNIIQAMINAHIQYSRYLHPNCTVSLPIYDRNWGYLASLMDAYPTVFQREL